MPLPTPTLAGTVAFARVIRPGRPEYGGSRDICVVNADGSDLKLLAYDGYNPS